jgi:predicted transcriptional regulator
MDTKSAVDSKFRALAVHKKYAVRIVQGKKTWELRKTKTRIRERIGIIACGTSTIVGTAEIVDCCEVKDAETLWANRDKHGVTSKQAIRDAFAQGYRFAWVLRGARELAMPVAYKHPRGAQMFVSSLPSNVVDAVRMQHSL